MDEFDDLLKPKRDSGSFQNRDAIFAKTTRVLLGRRWARITRRVGAAFACFTTGVLLTWSLTRPLPEPNTIVRRPDPVPEQVVKSDTPDDPYRNDPPVRIERWAAMAEGDKRVTLYRRAGDLHLNNGDQLAAIRCYRSALKSSQPDDLVVQPDKDSWLLMSLKIDRQKETKNAQN